MTETRDAPRPALAGAWGGLHGWAHPQRQVFAPETETEPIAERNQT
jgi:hypothetical protein